MSKSRHITPHGKKTRTQRAKPRPARRKQRRAGARRRASAARAAVGASDTPYHHGALRDALLQAAERVLERDGLAGLTLRAVAREAGVSHAAPTHHFGDLTGLVSELAAIGFRQFNAAMAAAGAAGSLAGARRRWRGPRPMSPMRRRIPACTG